MKNPACFITNIRTQWSNLKSWLKFLTIKFVFMFNGLWLFLNLTHYSIIATTNHSPEFNEKSEFNPEISLSPARYDSNIAEKTPIDGVS